MWKRHLSFSISFGLIALLNLFIEILNIQEVRIFIRPLVCILLLGYLITKTKLYGVFSKLIFWGLLFSLVGDFVLIFAGSRTNIFLIGLGAFLVAHIFYSIAFYRDYKYDVRASQKYGNIMLMVITIFSIIFFIWIHPYLNEMVIPIMVYMLVISVMAILAGFRYGRVNTGSFSMILTGAVFFVISDTLLAINKLMTPFLYSGVLVIATYMIAQYLITIGTLERNVAARKET